MREDHGSSYDCRGMSVSVEEYMGDPMLIIRRTYPDGTERNPIRLFLYESGLIKIQTAIEQRDNPQQSEATHLWKLECIIGDHYKHPMDAEAFKRGFERALRDAGLKSLHDCKCTLLQSARRGRGATGRDKSTRSANNKGANNV